MICSNFFKKIVSVLMVFDDFEDAYMYFEKHYHSQKIIKFLKTQKKFLLTIQIKHTVLLN